MTTGQLLLNGDDELAESSHSLRYDWEPYASASDFDWRIAAYGRERCHAATFQGLMLTPE